jgi:hypothetical protein
MSEIAAAMRPPFSIWLFLRTALGLILAPILGGAVGMAAFSFFDGVGKFEGWPRDISSIAFIGAYLGGVYGLLPALIIGWPIHLLLLRQRWTHPLVYIAIGPLLAGLAFIAIGLTTGALMDFD